MYSSSIVATVECLIVFISVYKARSNYLRLDFQPPTLRNIEKLERRKIIMCGAITSNTMINVRVQRFSSKQEHFRWKNVKTKSGILDYTMPSKPTQTKKLFPNKSQ
jgi:hypothetical protein